jgi:two-component system NtrC family sensor kinase
LMDKQLSDEGVSVRCDLMKELPLVLGVGDQIQQVLLNLVLNAVEAMRSKDEAGSMKDEDSRMMDEENEGRRGGVIYIETGTNPRNSREVEILIEDSGPGIPPSQRKHIFEPFVSSKDGGTGLGLTVSYGIVTAHGGSLDLVEQGGFYPNQDRKQGACFRISLPVASEEEG